MAMRTAVKDASLSIVINVNGIPTSITSRGSLYSTTTSDKGSGKGLSTFCPECADPSPIRYRLHCDHNHGPFQRNEVLYGKVVNDKVVIVDSDQADSARTSDIARGKLSLSVFDRESFVEATIPTGTPYHFTPNVQDAEDAESYAIIQSAITHNRNWVFVCRANIGRGSEQIVSIEPGPFGGLTVQPHAYPQGLYDLPEHEFSPLSKSDAENVRSLLNGSVSKFNPDEWVDRLAEKIDTLVEESKSTRTSKRSKSKKVATEVGKPSLLSAIAASAKAS